MQISTINMNCDIPLFFTVIECWVLLFSVWRFRRETFESLVFLSLFLIGVSVDVLDTLLYWSAYIRSVYLADAVHIFFILKFSAYLKAPALFLYVRSTIDTNNRLVKRDILHILPLVWFPVFIALLYNSLGRVNIYAAAGHYHILFANPVFQSHILLSHFVSLFYSIKICKLFIGYRKKTAESYMQDIKLNWLWLHLLAVGFMAVWGWGFATYFLGVLTGAVRLSNTMGIVGNYYVFLYVNLLFFYKLIENNLYHSGHASIKKQSNLDAVNSKHVATIIKIMEEDQFFLDPDATLEQLAEKASLSYRQTSNILNRHFKKNFFEFVNHYRIERAKELLGEKNRHNSILDVMADAGFNSKSAFNRCFKKVVNMTPREFRDLALLTKAGH